MVVRHRNFVLRQTFEQVLRSSADASPITTTLTLPPLVLFHNAATTLAVGVAGIQYSPTLTAGLAALAVTCRGGDWILTQYWWKWWGIKAATPLPPPALSQSNEEQVVLLAEESSSLGMEASGRPRPEIHDDAKIQVHKYDEIIELLELAKKVQENDADCSPNRVIDQPDGSGDTPLILEIRHGCHFGVLALLLLQRPKLDIKNRSGQTAMDIAAAQRARWVLHEQNPK